MNVLKIILLIPSLSKFEIIPLYLNWLFGNSNTMVTK